MSAYDRVAKRRTIYAINNETVGALLFPQGFLRIHKQYLVNMAYLRSLQSTNAVLSVGKSLPVRCSQANRDIKQKYVKWQAQQIW